MILNKYLRAFLVFLSLFFLINSSAYAVCPVCTIAVAGGLGISRLIGIDDVVAGLWVGGLILSSSFWLSDFMKKKGWKIPMPTIFSATLFYLFTIPPLFLAKMIGNPANKLWGADKLLMGMIIGSIVFLVGVWGDRFLRSKNEGKVFFYYQKVILPVFLLSLTSFIFYLVTIK